MSAPTFHDMSWAGTRGAEDEVENFRNFHRWARHLHRHNDFRQLHQDNIEAIEMADGGGGLPSTALAGMHSEHMDVLASDLRYEALEGGDAPRCPSSQSSPIVSTATAKQETVSHPDNSACPPTVNAKAAPIASMTKQETFPRTMRTPTNLAVTEPVCHFWRLPTELLEMVFDFAFGVECKGIITKTAFARTETDRARREGHCYVAKAMPARKVEDFMVSKDFFRGAVKAWFAAQKWSSGPTPQSTFFRQYLLHQYAACVIVSTESRTPRFSKYLQAKDITVDLHARVFDELQPAKYVWLDPLGEIDFEKLQFTASLKKKRHLKTLTFKPLYCQYARDPEQKTIWERNVQALREYLWPFVSASAVSNDRRQTLSKPQKRIPLYHGSMVRYDKSKLLPADHYKNIGKGDSVAAIDNHDSPEEAFANLILPPPNSFAELGRRTILTPQQVWRLIACAQETSKVIEDFKNA